MAVWKYLFGILPFIRIALPVPLIDDDGVPELQWPQKYTIDIIKVFVDVGLEETLTVWQDKYSNQMRVDYNKGVVKQFYIKQGDDNETIKEEIHPETNGDNMNTFICHRLPSDSDDGFFNPDDILPNINGFKLIGTEVKNGVSSSKFSDVNSDGDKKLVETLWASYNKSSEEWIPVKYEMIEYGNWRGSVKKHHIWDFDNYESDFDEEVFNFEPYCENEKAERVTHDTNDEVITKHLIFMDPENEKHVNHVFEAFKTKYKKDYADKTEHATRKAIFHRNMRFMVTTNRKNLGYKLAINHFSDRTREEMKRFKGLKHSSTLEVGTDPFPYNESQLKKLSSEIPTEYDLRLLGVISPVKSQETCGSCWSFASTSTAEGVLARSNGGSLVRLSQQALIDCSWQYNNKGCNGGDETDAFKWMKEYGMPTEEEYGAYTLEDGICMIENMTKLYKFKGFTNVTPNSVGALKVALYYHGPVAISIDAEEGFDHYSSGILYDVTCSATYFNHVVTLVGYGEAYGETFWILKNSYGTDWGIDGYFYISAKNNNCGVMSKPVFVIY